MTEKKKMLNLKQKRKEAGLTQSQLAEAIGVHSHTIFNYEAGYQQPTLQHLKSIAEVLQCTIDALVSQNESAITFEELEKAGMPLVELLRKKGHPHMNIIVSQRQIRITEDKMGVPLDYDD